MTWEEPMIGLLKVLDARLKDGDVAGARAQIERMIEDFSSSPYSLTNKEDLV
tara:strand:+ start:1646 stop:1801 length:156 start_codon:yes stop_codon:yes gene_type:complete